METIKLASRIVMQQATDWNVDTAAVLPMGAFPCSAAYTYVSNVEAT